MRGIYRGADKPLAQPGRKQAAPVKSVMGREMDLTKVKTGGGLLRKC
jgi:hypothetical protein